MVRHKVALAAVLAVAGALAPRAHADVYTWVDAAGNVNVSNLAPPAGARIRSVAREDPAAVARAEAARTAARDAELRALAERVAELERAAEPVRAPAPVRVLAPPPPPAPHFSVTMMSTTPDEPAPSLSPSCGSLDCVPMLGSPFYAPAVVVVAAPAPRRHHRDHTTRRPGVPPLAASPRGPRRG